MRKKRILFIVVFLILVVLLSDGHTQDYRKWHLPEGAKLRLGKGTIHNIKFSPDGTQFAVASDTGVWIYDAHTHKEIALLAANTNFISSVAYSSDNKTLALTRRYDQRIELWDLHRKKQKATLKGERGRVEVVAFAPQGQILASASNSEIILWDSQTGKPKFKFRGPYRVNTLAFSPDGKTLAIGNRNSNVNHLWDTITGAYLATLEGHTNGIDAIAFSPDGVTLASGSKNGAIRLWDIKTRTYLATLKDYPNSINAIAFSPDGKTLAVVGGPVNTLVRLWDVNTRKLRATIEGEITSVYPYEREMLSVTFSPDGSTLASANESEIWLWDVKTDKCITTLTSDHSWLAAVPFSSEGKVFASESRNGTIHLWDIATAQISYSLTGQVSRGLPLAFSADGSMFASKSEKNTIQLWNTDTGEPNIALHGNGYVYAPIAFSPNGAKLAFREELRILLWDTHTGKLNHKLAGHFGGIRSIVFSPDGTKLASTGEDQRPNPAFRESEYTTRLWDIETAQLLATFRWDALPDRYDSDAIETVAFSPNGEILAGTGSGGLQLWDARTRGVSRKPLAIFTDIRSNTLTFSPDGKILAVGSRPIRLLDTETGKLRATLGEHPLGITSLTFSSDGEVLTSSGGGIVLLWNWQKAYKPRGN